MNKIIRTQNSPTAVYASQELAKYLTKITQNNDFSIHSKAYDESDKENGILLCRLSEIGINIPTIDNKLDDSTYISIKNGRGVIAGSNDRAILIGVYRFLTIIGCRFLRPGEDGEFIVRIPLYEMHAFEEHTASLRHRGICIEGAVSYENLIEVLDWLPKIGANSYFAQFPTSYTFFNQWYSHLKNPYVKPEYYDKEIAAQMTHDAAMHAKKLGLIYHAVGHGWTCGCIGIEGLNWDPEKIKLTPEQESCVAQINGERVLYGDIAVDTNLCYSSEKVQNLLTDYIVKYAKEHPEADYLHLWIADNCNNHCECENCAQMTPSDWYVNILTILDKKLEKENLPVKIVFLLYFELLWPPEKNIHINKNRFTLMFAPFTRTFEQAYCECKDTEYKLPEFVRNNITLPKKTEEYIAHLKAWQKIFDGDSFDYDYYLCKAHYGDPSYYRIASLISRDVKYMKEMGINGIIDCQVIRAAFPNGLPMYVLMQTMWDDTLEFDDIVNDYLSHCYGEDWRQCKKYLSSLAECFDVEYFQVPTKDFLKPEYAQKLSSVEEIVSEFEPVVQTNISRYTNKTLALSWDYMQYHLTYCRLFAKFMSAKSVGDDVEANIYWTDFFEFVFKNEPALQRVLDVYYLTHQFEYFMKFRRIIDK